MSHRDLVRPCDHVAPHTRFVLPRRHRPERPTAIQQERTCQKAGRSFYLLQRPPSMKREEGKESHRADSESGETNENHFRVTNALRSRSRFGPSEKKSGIVHSPVDGAFPLPLVLKREHKSVHKQRKPDIRVVSTATVSSTVITLFHRCRDHINHKVDGAITHVSADFNASFVHFAKRLQD